MHSKRQLTLPLQLQPKSRDAAGSGKHKSGKQSMPCCRAGSRQDKPHFESHNGKLHVMTLFNIALQALHMHQLARTKAEEEERIAAVLQQRMHNSERKAKELQQLRNESAELRDLQASRHHYHCKPALTCCATTQYHCQPLLPPAFMVTASLVPGVKF